MPRAALPAGDSRAASRALMGPPDRDEEDSRAASRALMLVE